jgi:ribosome-associated toxin RatA of RatAB toxin-antitoxin module
MIMASVNETIDVAVPVSMAYNQWTQFESFPQFMHGVQSVRQLSDTTNHWTVKVAGVEREFDTKITEQHPDQRIAWKSTDGTSHAGAVDFHRLDERHTRVTVQLDWDPQTFVEKAGAASGADKMQVKSDLKRFKEFVETQGSETGAWRGKVDRPGDASTGPSGPSETAGAVAATGTSTAGTGDKDNSLGSRDYYGGTGAGGFPPGGTDKDDLPIEDPAARSDKPLLDDPALAETSKVPLQDVPGGTLNDPDNEPDPDTDETGRNSAGR